MSAPTFPPHYKFSCVAFINAVLDIPELQSLYLFPVSIGFERCRPLSPWPNADSVAPKRQRPAILASPERSAVPATLLLVKAASFEAIIVNLELAKYRAGKMADQCHGSKKPLLERPNDLLVDHILFGRSTTSMPNSEQSFSLKGIGLLSGTYSVTFFSDSRLEILSAKLKNRKIHDLLRRISVIINSKVKATSSTSTLPIPERSLPPLNHTLATKYILTYFEQVHPLFPHIDRKSFDYTVSSGKLDDILISDTAFSALYYSVLALGCLYDGGGSFEPGKGDAWDLFSVALALLPDLQKSPNPLVALQAMTTASVYALGVPCLSIEQKIITETARMVQDLTPALSKGFSGPIFCRIFWVVYAIEKTSSFHFGRASVIIDSNIILPLPDILESSFGTFSWALIMARHCRLLSRAMDTLFCPGVCQKGSQYFLLVIDQLQRDLEEWMMSIPEDFRPKSSYQRHLLRRSIRGAIGIWINYLYYSLKLILLRSRLQINSHQDHDSAKGVYRDQLVDVSRSILEMVTYIDVEPSTPLWIVAGIPLSALFVLFDQVISNPKSPDTRSNLALLDIAGGHFARIEFASGGSLPGSLISEFTYIAREYVNQHDAFDGQQFSVQATDRNITPPVIADNRGMPASTSENDAQRTLPMTPPNYPATVPNTMPLVTPLYAPIETLWDHGNNPLFGIDVMDIFSSIM
ncbi:hypothetical protein FLAG1_09511 [Fusarium langsethiae]|uniref:Xylanolytic transcriptional activator regulatory domain-containing protein n=1 Tax=Fusarium langsethiae TaxID=179993 RepID=A0A0M9EQ81_FUSLA|nr:hypothetical protein FLAG1_09511 [Fusarium langsethiae]GKU06630.1 unnamed protein product [Fusarium langsethiae]GKU21958.1 unnamed protein product [Fusarium langsethiae]